MMLERPIAPIPTLRRTLRLSALLVLAATSLRAQEYSFRELSTADGLGNLTIQTLHQDRTGFIWVGTENGIFRYDGEHFESIGSPQGILAITTVAFGEAPDGSLIIGSPTGLYHQVGDRFEKLDTPFTTVDWSQGIASDGHGHTWVATPTGLFSMTSTTHGHFAFQQIYPLLGSPAENVGSIYLDGTTLWFGCGTKLCHLDSGKLTTYGPETGVPATPIKTVLKDHNGALWIHSYNEGILTWPVGAPGFIWPNTPIPGKHLAAVPALDSTGHILLGTPKGLLIQRDHGWQLLDHKNGLRGGIYTALEDHNHSLWLGTGGRGLIQWRGYRQWEGYSSATALPADNAYETLPQADGSLYVATEAGLLLGKPTTNSAYFWTTVPGTASIPTHAILRDPSGDLWLGTASKGLARLHAGKLTWFSEKEGIPAKYTLTLRVDSNHNLWATSEAGIFTAAPPYTSFTRVTELPAKWFWTFAQSTDGTLWAGGNEGLFAFTAGHWRHYNDKGLLSNKIVTALGPDSDGAIWIGYQHGGGIDRAHLTATGHLSVQHGLQRPGTDGLVYFLTFDHAHNMWVGTEHGIDRWDGAHWSHFDTSDGLIWDDCDLNGFAAAPDGSLWFGTSGGLSHFTPICTEAATSPTVVFTGLHFADADIFNLSNPSFPFDSGSLVAHFAAPGTPQENNLLFRYRLDGQRSPWTETSLRQLELPSLSPGYYTFEVQARDNTGLWSPHTATYSFRITPPWYRRWWFLTLLFSLPFAAAALLYRSRSYAATMREERLRRVVEARTAELSAANSELLRLTLQDALTGLSNRRHFDQAIAHECEHVSRSGATVSLILIDVDHFKALNDYSGHQKGDEYLVLLGKELAAVARRKIEVAARVGGEEFALLLPATPAAGAARVAEDFRRRIESLALLHPASSVGPYLTVSLGIATATPGDECSPERLVAQADKALYRAKSQGRNRIEIA